MLLPLRAFLDPALQRCNFRFAELLVCVCGRHPPSRIRSRNPVHQNARSGVAFHDRVTPAAQISLRKLLAIEAERDFLGRRIRSVADKALIRQNRADIAIEFDWTGPLPGEPKCEKEYCQGTPDHRSDFMTAGSSPALKLTRFAAA